LSRQRNARLLLGSAFVSEIGDWFNIVALLALAARFGDGALSVGVMLAVRMAPRLLFQVPAGAIVDRFASPRFLVVVQLAMGLVAASFALIAAVPNLWLLYGLVFALETINTVAWPAFRVELGRSLTADQRAPANGLLGLAMTVGQLIGPTIGWAILTVAAPTAVFLLNGLTFVGNAVAVSRIDRHRTIPFVPDNDAPQTHGGVGLAGAAGYRWLLRQPTLAAFTGVFLAANLMVQGTIALFVSRATALGLGQHGTGVFYTSVAVGTIVGSAAAGVGEYRHRGALYLVAGALAAMAVALGVFGVAGGIPLALVALVAAGIGTDVGEVVGTTHFQHHLPEALWGRFLSILLVGVGMGGVIGVLSGPLLAKAVGISGALVLLAVPVVVLCGILAAITRRAHPQADTDPMAFAADHTMT